MRTWPFAFLSEAYFCPSCRLPYNEDTPDDALGVRLGSREHIESRKQVRATRCTLGRQHGMLACSATQEVHSLIIFPRFKQHISSPDDQVSSLFPILMLFVRVRYYTHLPQHHGGVVGTAGRVNTLRRTTGNICSIKHGHKTAISLSPNPHHAVEDHTREPSPSSGPKPLTPILEQGDSSESVADPVSPSDSTDSLLVNPAHSAMPILEQGDLLGSVADLVLPSDSTDGLLVNPADSAIYFIDGDSGALFRVQHASGAFTSTEQFVLERSSLTSSLSLRIGSPPAPVATDLDTHIESLPSFVLTLPTPGSPRSPIFSPGVHFTTEKFLGAAEAASPRDRAPPLPQCDHMQGQGQGKEDRLCRACEMQLLACRVWFQNADGGARAALHEPFVRPAQSTVRTRAVLASVGVGAPRCSSGVGLGIADGRRDEIEGTGVRDGDEEDGDEDIGDPGYLAIEAIPAASSRLEPLGRAISWSRVVLGKLRRGLKSPSLTMSTIWSGKRRRTCRRRV